MRLIIESDDRLTTPQTPTGPDLHRMAAIDAGPPAAELVQSVTTVGEGVTARSGIDAGGPPASLLQALQSTAAPPGTVVGADGNGGAAPR